MDFLDTPEKRERRLVHLPMGRFGEPIELARAALFCKFQTFFFLYRIKACMPCDIFITAWFLVLTFWDNDWRYAYFQWLAMTAAILQCVSLYMLPETPPSVMLDHLVFSRSYSSDFWRLYLLGFRFRRWRRIVSLLCNCYRRAWTPSSAKPCPPTCTSVRSEVSHRRSLEQQ